MSIASNIIRSEHCEMECVLAGLERVARELRFNSHKPESGVLWSLLDWVEAFPDTFHHPKEEELLFPAVISRCPAAISLVDRLIDEHARGVELMTELRRSLEIGGGDSMDVGAFFEAAIAYVKLERDHIRMEDQGLLPLAARHLTKEDWARIESGFTRNANPLLTARRRGQFNDLFVQILQSLSREFA